MGIFDRIRCEYPVPDPDLTGAEFQTKNLGMPGMHAYRITSDGRLIRCAELTSDGKKPRVGTFLARDVDWPLTGRINMGTFRPELGPVEYVVRLSEGRVLWIKKKADLPPPTRRHLPKDVMRRLDSFVPGARPPRKARRTSLSRGATKNRR